MTNKEPKSVIQKIFENVQAEGNITVGDITQILKISVDEIKTCQFIQTSPYKGLKKFELEDKDLFFGRDQLITQLVKRLEHRNLILLLGASGSGKSSVVRAGLIPWLSRSWGSHFVHLTFTPDQDPFESLYASLLSKFPQKEAQIAREAKADTVTQVVTKLKQLESFWFIFIDQFEELFTTTVPEKRDQFINGLIKLSQIKNNSVKIMGTMRADFLDKLSPYPQLIKTTDDSRPLIAEMQPDELRLAIEQPAAHHGVVFETGLVEEIIKNVQGQAGYLPLLQYTLNLLWETEVQTSSIYDRTLNISTYRELGGVRGALQQHTDGIYDKLPETEKLAAKRIFLKLVGITGNSESDTEWKPVLKRALRSEFSDKLEQILLVKLIDENLLVSDRQPQSQESTVEIAHEMLLTAWTVLNYWIKENHQAIALRNRLYDDVARWQGLKAKDELWAGSKLEQVIELRNDATFNQVLGGFNETASQFIDASLGLRDRQRRRTIIGLSGFSVVALILAGAAGLGWWFTEFQRQQTITGLTTASQELFDSNKEFDALLASLNAGKQVKQAAFGVNSDMQFQVKIALQQAIYGVKERNRLEGHKAGVLGISYSPDGKTLASASGDTTIKLWDVATGKEINTLTGHKDVVNIVSFNPDGRLLASSSADGIIKLWDITTGKEIKTLNGLSVSFSSNNLLASGNGDGTIKLWDVTTGKEIKTLKGHSNKVEEVSFSPDGQLLASISVDTIKLWDVTTGKEIWATSQGFLIDTVSFSPNGQWLAFSGEERNIYLWNLASKKEVTLRGHSRSRSVSFSRNGQILASANWDNTIKLWDIATKREIKTLTGHKAEVESVNFSPDGKLLASASLDNTIKLWDMVPRKEMIPLTSNNVGDGISFSPDGKLLASIGLDEKIKLWDVATHKEIATLTGHTHWIRSVSFSPDGQWLASAAWDNTIKLWDVRTCIEVTICEARETLQWNSWLTSVSFSPDGRLLASASWDYNNPKNSSIQLWDIATRPINPKPIKILQGHTNSVNSISFSPDGQWLVSGSADQTIKIWDVANGIELSTLTGHTDKVRAVSFSPDGQWLVSGSADQTIKIWDVANGKEINTLQGHKAPVIGVSFSPDGQWLVSGSADQTIKIWDVANGKEINTLKGHRTPIRNLSLSNDGQLIASGGDPNFGKIELILWNVKALSNLTLEEQMGKGCDWVRGYLQTNPNVSNSDKQLCNGIGIAK